MSRQPFLSVIIPSYNEAKNISRGVLEEVLSYLQAQSYDWELIFSDDGSTDSTVKTLLAFAKKDKRIIVLKNHHAGKAPTVKAGMLAARGEWRLFTDFDQSTPLSEVEQFFPLIKKNYDIIIGSREISGAKRDEEPLHRHIMGKGFNMLVQVLAVPGIMDTQCGFKLLSAQATEKLFNTLYIYGGKAVRKDAYTGAFDVELLYLARKYNFKIKEIPITWKHAESDRVSPIKDSLRMLRDIIAIRFADLQHKYS